MTTPLLQRRDLLTRFWPHVASTDYRLPHPDSLPAYQHLRRQMLVLKIPDLPAAAYMEQVGDALVAVLDRTAATR